MSGSADAAAAAAGGGDAGKYDRTRMSKVHDELRPSSRCDRVKPVIDSLKSRSKGLGTSQMTPSRLAALVKVLEL